MIDFDDYSRKQIIAKLLERGEILEDCISNMETYGGSFVKSLALLCRSADHQNLKTALEAFLNYFIDYQPKRWLR